MELVGRLQQIVGIALVTAAILYLNLGLGGPEEQFDPVAGYKAIETFDFLLRAGIIFIVFGLLATAWLAFRGAKFKMPLKILTVINVLIALGYFGFQYVAV